MLCGCKLSASFEANDPLQIWILPLHHLPIQIPAPGKYEVALLANGTEVASDTLLALGQAGGVRGERPVSVSSSWPIRPPRADHIPDIGPSARLDGAGRR